LRDIVRRTVAFETDLAPGSIVVRTGERKLYYVLGSGQAIQYPVGVGREGFEWSGTNRITRKIEWPEWRPPRVMIAREAARGHYIPEYMPGGPQNPLGARALYIGNTEYRIHGTSQPGSIGMAMSSGCIRMMNDQVIDLYDRVQIGATVIVE
jgi:lipoprotein-anchoring transpeptidase ErfK/SrfK